MSTTFLVFNAQITFSLILLALIAAWWVLPRLRTMDPGQALAIPLLIGATRYMGMVFLVPSLTPGMPPEFGVPTAFGDTASAVLALIAAIASYRGSALGRPLAWAYVVLGGGDLAYGFAQGFRYGLWDHMPGPWTYIMFMAPAVIVAIGLTVILLVKPAVAAARAQAAR